MTDPWNAKVVNLQREDAGSRVGCLPAMSRTGRNGRILDTEKASKRDMFVPTSIDRHFLDGVGLQQIWIQVKQLFGCISGRFTATI